MEGGLNREGASQVTADVTLEPCQRPKHYRIIVGNNPVNFVDPSGLHLGFFRGVPIYQFADQFLLNDNLRIPTGPEPVGFPAITKPCLPIEQMDDLVAYINRKREFLKNPVRSKDPFAESYGVSGSEHFWGKFSSDIGMEWTVFRPPYGKAGGCVQRCVQLHESWHRCEHSTNETIPTWLSIRCALLFIILDILD